MSSIVQIQFSIIKFPLTFPKIRFFANDDYLLWLHIYSMDQQKLEENYKRYTIIINIQAFHLYLNFPKVR